MSPVLERVWPEDSRWPGHATPPDAGAAGDADAPDGDDGSHHELDGTALEEPISRPHFAAVGLDDEQAAQLLCRIVERDERALADLFDHTSSKVHALVQRMTRRAALTEEVVADTYWQVWRQAPRFDPQRGRVITWLLSMARSRAIDAMRRDQRFRHEEWSDDNPAGSADGPRAAGADELLAATRGSQQLQAALTKLEPRARQCVAMAFFRGLTHEEIAEQTQQPLGTVKSVIRRALQQLKSELAGLGLAKP